MVTGSTKPKWNDELVFKIYDLARSGLKKTQIAEALGITKITFRRWLENRPLVGLALKRGKEGAAYAREAANTYQDYVYNRLPTNLQELWDKIQAASKAKNGQEVIEAMLSDQGKMARQQLFLHALIASNFSLTHACHSVNIPKATYNTWVRCDPQFGDLVDAMYEAKKDFFEATLVEAARSGDTAAIIFANKTLNADRGYNPATKVQVEGNINVNVSVQPIDKLNLPLNTRKQILEALRVIKPKLDDSDMIIDMPLLPPASEDENVF